MKRVVSRMRTCRSQRRRTQASKSKPADAVTQRSASPNSKAQPIANENPPLTPSGKKRRRDAAPEVEFLPTKRPRLTRAGIQRSANANEKAEQIIQQLPRSPPKRRYDTFPSDNGNEPELKRARLTRTNLALFDKMVKKGTNHSSRSALGKSTNISSSKTTSTTTSGFALQADKNGILDPTSSRPPTNLSNIHERYNQSRRTASPTESVYDDYVNRVERAVNETTMVIEVSGKLLKEYPDKRYTRAFNQAFTEFPKDAGFNHGLSAPQPDFVEGLEIREFRPFPIDEQISGAVLYKDNPRSISLPHLAGEWKGRGKDMDEARVQSAFDGAALVYSRNQALSYLGKSDPVGHAEITTFTTDGTTLNLFAHYTAPSEDGVLEYHQYRIKSTSLIDTHQGHKDGRRGLRNEQDHAKKQSGALRDELKNHWKQRCEVLHAIAEEALPMPGIGLSGRTNTDEEDETGYEVIRRPCEPTPPTSSKARTHCKDSSSRSSLSTLANDSGSSNIQNQKASSAQVLPRRSLRQKERAKKVKH